VLNAECHGLSTFKPWATKQAILDAFFFVFFIQTGSSNTGSRFPFGRRQRRRISLDDNVHHEVCPRRRGTHNGA
jgi:hypothetical protein